MLIILHIIPKSASNQIIGWVYYAEGKRALKVKINALPEDGRANAELIRFLAKEWKVAKSALEIVNGETSRHKRLKIHDPELAENLDALIKSAE
jgi:uncharacterized protein (TIGR00251 family)